MRSIEDKRLMESRHLIVCWSISPARVFFEAGIMGVVGASLRFASWEWQIENPRTVLLVDCITGTPSAIRDARARYPDRAVIAVIPDYLKESVARVTLAGADAALTPQDASLDWIRTISEQSERYVRRGSLANESPVSILKRIEHSARD